MFLIPHNVTGVWQLKKFCTCLTRAERTKLNPYVLCVWLNVEQVQFYPSKFWRHIVINSRNYCLSKTLNPYRSIFSGVSCHLPASKKSKIRNSWSK